MLGGALTSMTIGYSAAEPYVGSTILGSNFFGNKHVFGPKPKNRDHHRDKWSAHNSHGHNRPQYYKNEDWGNPFCTDSYGEMHIFLLFLDSQFS